MGAVSTNVGEGGMKSAALRARSNGMRTCVLFLWALLSVWVLPLQAQTVEYVHTDALGTPVAITNAAGQVIERSEYEPYGTLVNRPLTDGPGFTGHVQDATTGLTYMQQRYYDPMIGRFLSVDPVTADSATGANFNRYWYANNNPYKFTDPDGRQVYMMTPPGDLDTESAGMLIDTVPIANDIKPVFTAILNPTLSNITSAAAGLTPAGDAARVVKVADKVADVAKGAAGGVRAGKAHTRAANRLGREQNRAANAGEMKCPTCSKNMNDPVQSKLGETVDRDAAVGDHKTARSKGGDGATVKDMRNHETICWECNSRKSDK